MAQKDEAYSILIRKLEELSSTSSSFWLSSISKVPHQLSEVNERAYTPQLISIGPYHHNTTHLQAMEIHKVRYLEKLILREVDPNIGLRKLEAISKNLEIQARDSYEESTVNMNSAEFVAMMVLDGCFVAELIHKFRYQELIERDDVLFKQNPNLPIIAQDLLLLEKQLPFFVLDKLFQETKGNQTDQPPSFPYLALYFFSRIIARPGKIYSEDHLFTANIKHLLGLVHDNWFRSPERRERQEQRVATRKWTFMRSTTELVELGIRFKKGKGSSLFDIKFRKGILYIPTLIVNHDTERIFRNLIAYEQFNQGSSSSIVMDYTRLMDCLINYDSDVVFLSECGIIDNQLGSNDAVANMFNKLNDYVYLSMADYYYSDIFDSVNEHYRQRWNKWKLKLKAKHSHTPWDWILVSIIAATILLLLTLAQTIYSVLAYYK
ncbi:hypothetical protein REPUB_Repub06bG0041900 [Reevesia pubescens]